MDRPRVVLAALSITAQGVKNSVHIDSSDDYIELVGDEDSPGASMVYGTDGSGNKGWQSSAVSVADGSVTNAKLANMDQATFKGRAAGAGTGAPTDLSVAQAKTALAYTGADVANTPAGNISATTVQDAIDELDTEKQPLDSDLTAIAALSPSNDDVIQRKSGVWTNRTMAQVKSDLSLSKSDVGLSNVDNTSDANKPVSTAQATADGLRVLKAGDSMTGPLAMGANKITGLANGTNPQDAVTLSQLTGNWTITSVDIGDWNMDSTQQKDVPHGLTLSKIRDVRVMIRDDAGTSFYPLDCGQGLGNENNAGNILKIDNTNVQLYRVVSRLFDSASFDSTSYNRGWVIIRSIP